jgi:signal transduction histidine kinase
MRTLFVLLFLANGVFSFGQIYRGVTELMPYERDLAELDEYVKSNPKKFQKKLIEIENRMIGKEDESLKAILFIYEGTNHHYLNERDSATYFFDKAISLSKKIGNDQIYRTAKIRRIFMDEYKKTKFQMAQEMEVIYIDSYNKKDTLNLIYSLNGLGLFYGDLDSVSMSINIFYEALNLAEMSNNMYEQAFVLNNLGLIKHDLGALDSAYADFNKCLQIGYDLNNLGLQSIGHQNLGMYYSSIDSNDMAKKEYLTVLKIGKENGYKLYEMSAMTNLASLEMSMGNARASDSLSTAALELAKNEMFLYAVTPIYFGKSYYLIMNEKYSESLVMLDSAEAYSIYSTQDVLGPFLHLKYRAYEEMGDFENALVFHKKKVEFQDSINELGNKKILAELQFRYDDEKKERIRSVEKNKLKLQIKQNEVDISNYRQKVILLISAFLIVLFVILVLYFRLKQRSDNLFSTTIINKLEEERGKIARNLHDGLGQSMIILKNRFNKLKIENNEGGAQLNDNFSEVIEEIRTISRSLIPPELRRLGLQKSIEKMMGDIEQTSNMIVTTEIDPLKSLELEMAQNIRIYRIIQELCTNTLKHSGASSIKLESIVDRNNLKLIYRDNGSGLDLEKWRSAENSVGFKSIQQRLKYLKGSIKVDKPKIGFKVEINIKLN